MYTDPSGFEFKNYINEAPYREGGRIAGDPSRLLGGGGGLNLGPSRSPYWYSKSNNTFYDRKTGLPVSLEEIMRSNYVIQNTDTHYEVVHKMVGSDPLHLRSDGVVYQLVTATGNVAGYSGVIPSSAGDWLKNIGTAASMFSDWVTGSGSEKRVFANDAATRAMSNAYRVNKAREFFYNKYKGQTDLDGAYVVNYKGSFGLLGLVRAGADPIEQYVGSCTINILCDGQDLYFVLKNNTSFESFFYGLGPDWNRSTFGPGGNMYQYYIWSEPLNPNKLK